MKHLQRRFFFTALLAVLVLLLFLLSAINIFNAVSVYKDNWERLEEIVEFESTASAQFFKNRPREETFLASSYFVVRENMVDTSRVADISASEARNLASQAEASEGRVGKYIYEKAEDVIVFLDVERDVKSILRVLLLSFAFGIFCFVLMVPVVLVLSKKAIKPVEESLEKQKQFITDAGHEIKTPLAIIQANTEAMTLIEGENKWTRNIHKQVLRLEGLMKTLLELSRMQEAQGQKTVFSLSTLLNEEIEAFREAFALKEVKVISTVEELELSSLEDRIKTLLSILLENSLKYTQEGGELLITLKSSGVMTLENTTEALPSCPADRLFERFYRPDEARSRKTGGYGIGLSIAASIVQGEKGEIKAEYPATNRIRFTIKFNKKAIS